MESKPFKFTNAGDPASAKLVDVALLRALELHAGVCAISSSAAVLLLGLFGINAEAEPLHRRLKRLQRLGLVRAGAESHDPVETGFQLLRRGKAYLARVRGKGLQGASPEQLAEVLGLPGTLTACVVKVAKHRRCSVFTLMEVAVFSAFRCKRIAGGV